MTTTTPQVRFTILGYEPTLILGFLTSLIVFAGGLGFSHLDPVQASLGAAVVAAIFGIINALAVRPVSPVAFTYAIGAIGTFLASYGFDIPTATLGALDALVIAGLTLILRGQVSPRGATDEPVTDEG
jgi:hypothetical protein